MDHAVAPVEEAPRRAYAGGEPRTRAAAHPMALLQAGPGNRALAARIQRLRAVQRDDAPAADPMESTKGAAPAPPAPAPPPAPSAPDAPAPSGGDSPSGAGACSIAPTLGATTYNDVSLSPTSAKDFFSQVDTQMASAGHMAFDWSWKKDTYNGPNKGLDSVDASLAVSVSRPKADLSGVTDADDKKWINTAIGLLSTHEGKHVTDTQKIAQDQVCAAFGKPAATARAELNKVTCKANSQGTVTDGVDGEVQESYGPDGKVTSVVSKGYTSKYSPSC